MRGQCREAARPSGQAPSGGAATGAKSRCEPPTEARTSPAAPPAHAGATGSNSKQNNFKFCLFVFLFGPTPEKRGGGLLPITPAPVGRRRWAEKSFSAPGRGWNNTSKQNMCFDYFCDTQCRCGLASAAGRGPSPHSSFSGTP